MKYDNIIWDYDGTLFDSYPAISLAFSDALMSIGIKEPTDEIIKQMKISIRNAIAFYHEKYGLNVGFLDNFKQRCKTAEEIYCRPFNGATDICSRIYRNGGRNFLFTHRDKSADYFLQKYSLAPFFIESVTSEYGFAHKPDPEGLLYLIEKYNLPLGRTVMIGDRKIDIDAGINAGIATCYFMDGGKPYQSADFNFNNFNELWVYLMRN